MITGIRNILLLAIAVYFSLSLTAQSKIQVVSRSINRTFTYSAETVIQVNGEKAQIKVRPSLNKQINLVITLVAKNPSLHEAEADVKFCNYTISESDGKIIIGNNFDVKKGYKEISSNLSARIELEIPGTLSLNIRNIYGTTDLKDIPGNINIKSDFGQLTLENISGYGLEIYSKYGDISGSQINTHTLIKAQNTDVIIKDVNKILAIFNQYGKIEIEKINAYLSINGELTAVSVSGLDFKNWSFFVKAKSGQIEVPKDYQKYLTSKSGDSNFIKGNGTYYIQIQTSYNNITLK